MTLFSKYKSLLLGLCGALVLLPLRMEPCADSGYYPFELFHIEQAGARQFYPFLFSSSIYRGEGYWEEGPEPDTLSRVPYGAYDLVTDWVTYTRGEVPRTDIYQYLYQMSAHQVWQGDTGAAFAYNSLSQSAQRNSLLTWASAPGRQALWDYLLYCKRVEAVFATINDPWGFVDEIPAEENYSFLGEHYNDGYQEEYQNANPGSWDYAAARPQATFLETLNKQAEAGLALAKDPWLRQRYAYQCLVMARYMGQPARAEQLYRTYLSGPDVPPGLSLWAQLYAGIALAKQDKRAEANLMLARVFARSSHKQRAAFEHFNTEATDQALALAKTNEDKAAIWVTAAAHNPAFNIEAVSKVEALTGHSELLRFLVLREVGKVDTYMPWEEQSVDYYYGDAKREPLETTGDWQLPLSPSMRTYLGKLAALCDAAGQNPRAGYRTQWNLMAAHLHVYLSDRSRALAALQRARATGLQPQQVSMINLYEALLLTFDSKLTVAQRYDRLAELLQPVAHKDPNGTVAGPTSEAGYLIIKRLEQLNDTVGADLVSCVVGFNTPYRAPQTLLNGLEKNRFGKLGTLAVAQCPDLMPHLYRVQAVLALLSANPEAAARFYEKAGDTEPSPWLDEDPAKLSYWQNHGSNKWPGGKTISPVTWCKDLAALQRSAGKDFQKNLALANCYYNMTYDGNSWYILSRYWSSPYYYDAAPTPVEDRPSSFTQTWPGTWLTCTVADQSSFLPPAQMLRYRNQYLGAELALTFYERALALAPNRKAAAAVALMVGRCRYRQTYRAFPMLYGGSDYADADAKTRTAIREHYTELYDRYPDLADELVSNCLTYERFLKVK